MKYPLSVYLSVSLITLPTMHQYIIKTSFVSLCNLLYNIRYDWNVGRWLSRSPDIVMWVDMSRCCIEKQLKHTVLINMQKISQTVLANMLDFVMPSSGLIYKHHIFWVGSTSLLLLIKRYPVVNIYVCIWAYLCVIAQYSSLVVWLKFEVNHTFGDIKIRIYNI